MALNINGTTGISGVEGSVSAPVLTGTDSNCGISFPAADTIKFSTGGVERMQITNSGVSGTGIGAGKILQVVSTTKTTQQTISTSGDTSYPSGAVDIMTIQITPTQSDSKVLITSTVQATCEDSAVLYMHRDTTLINVGTVGSSSNNGAYRGWALVRQGVSNQAYSYNTQFLDSPATTSAITYKIKGLNTASSESLYINRRKSSDTYSLTSFLTVMEVAA